MGAVIVPLRAFDGSVFQISQLVKFSLTWLYIINTTLQALPKKNMKMADPKTIHWKSI